MDGKTRNAPSRTAAAPSRESSAGALVACQLTRVSAAPPTDCVMS